MDYVALKSEILTDSLVRGYAGMTDQEVADDMNTVYRTRNRVSMTGKEVKDQITNADWISRSDAQKSVLLSQFARDDLNPFGIDADIFVDAMTGAVETSVADLAAYRVEAVSRAEELGFGVVTGPDIDSARREA